MRILSIVLNIEEKQFILKKKNLCFYLDRPLNNANTLK